MSIANTDSTPPVWDDAALAAHAQAALEEFVERRLGESAARYAEHLQARRHAIKRLVRRLNPVDVEDPDLGVVRAILLDEDLQGALRYVAGPPISFDDLGVLVTRGTGRLSKTKIKTDDALAAEVLRLICRIADPGRFPWIRENRPPRRYELKQAIRATAALHAAQTMQTERRGYGKLVEGKLQDRLVAMRYRRVPSPNGGKINLPAHMPQAGTFYGECTVQGRRADLLIGLPDGRSVGVEAKDSSSVVNSVKRVLNDTAAKARHWRSKFGETLVPVALLSGVFGQENLRAAQSSGLFLVWAHDLGSFTDWLQSQ